MKTVKLFTLALMILAFASCSKDEESDNSTNPSPTQNSIENEWSMVFISNGLAGYQEFDAGEVLWTFDEDNQVTLEYIIPQTEVNQFPPMKPGTYTYTVEDDRIKLTKSTEVWHDFYFENGGLIIENDPEADGIRMEFEEF
jgi:hypothetical protein